MTKSEFKRNIETQGNDIHFELAGRKFNVGYLPVPLGNGKYGFDRIGICDEAVLDIAWYKTVDEMLENHEIDGGLLIKQLNDVKNMHGIPTA